MTGKSTAKPTTGIELTTVCNAHLRVGEILWLSCRLIGVFVSIMALPTVAVVSDVIPTIRREAMTISTTPFPLCMACGGTVPCDGIIYNATQFDGARSVIQIVLIIAVAVLTLEVLPLHVEFVRACIWRAIVTIGAA